MRRGEVYVAEIEPRSGSEQRGKRPVIVLMRDSFNVKARWMSIMVVPVSTTDIGGPTSVRLTRGTAGLQQNCFALCHQVTTLDRRKFRRLLGALSSDTLRAVEEGVMIAMDLPTGITPPPHSP